MGTRVLQWWHWCTSIFTMFRGGTGTLQGEGTHGCLLYFLSLVLIAIKLNIYTMMSTLDSSRGRVQGDRRGHNRANLFTCKSFCCLLYNYIQMLTQLRHHFVKLAQLFQWIVNQVSVRGITGTKCSNCLCLSLLWPTPELSGPHNIEGGGYMETWHKNNRYFFFFSKVNAFGSNVWKNEKHWGFGWCLWCILFDQTPY